MWWHPLCRRSSRKRRFPNSSAQGGMAALFDVIGYAQQQGLMVIYDGKRKDRKSVV